MSAEAPSNLKSTITDSPCLAVRRRPPSGPDGSYLPWIVGELTAIAKYYDRTIEWRPDRDESPQYLDAVDCPDRRRVVEVGEFPDLGGEHDRRTLVLLDCRNRAESEILTMLSELQRVVGRTTRVAIIRRRPARLRLAPSAWEMVRVRALLLRKFHGLALTILRPVLAHPADDRPSLSIVIPARNERGNIAGAVARLPDFGGAAVEVIFVEGHSSDGTWEEIERVRLTHGTDAAGHSSNRGMRVVAIRQTGRGKADAVRAGFAAATGDLLAILDADLTMPPEKLREFYEAYREGRGDFINGDRLSSPMEVGAMRPLNKLGNRFFALALSHTLDVSISDALCGTKLFARHDYPRFAAWRADFGERDPFGDFDLLFPAAALALGCANLPVHYAARTYGETNIHRFRDGARLLAMTLAGWRYIKAGVRK